MNYVSYLSVQTDYLLLSWNQINQEVEHLVCLDTLLDVTFLTDKKNTKRRTWRVFLLPCSVKNQALKVKSWMNSSQALASSTGASALII